MSTHGFHFQIWDGLLVTIIGLLDIRKKIVELSLEIIKWSNSVGPKLFSQ